MVDVVDKATRSRMMSGIRGKNTKPELLLRRGLHAKGFRFRIHAHNIPGKPDIVLPKYNALILVHGCFWHGHGCRYCKLPASNTVFWKQKIERSIQRDQAILNAQCTAGWRILLIWECAIRNNHVSHDVVDSAASWLQGHSRYAVIDEHTFREE